MFPIVKSIIDLLFPNLCIACEQTLLHEENVLCISCQAHLPYSKFDNVLKTLLNIEHLPIEHAPSFLIFQNENITQKLLHSLKYQDRKDVGIMLGKQWGQQLMQEHWMNEVDALCPIPLHKTKEQKRGYNQSELLAKGIATSLDIPVYKNVLTRTVATTTQTRKSDVERLINVKNIFRVADLTRLRSLKHVMLIDDVITTGATLTAAALEIKKQLPQIKVSIGALALAQ